MAIGPDGRLVAVITDPARADYRDILVVVGNQFSDTGAAFTGQRHGRAPTAEERAKAAPYRAPTYEPAPPAGDEDDLDDQEALRLCRLEQQRAPVDLLRAA